MSDINDIIFVEKRKDYIYTELKLKVNLNLTIAQELVRKRIELSEGKDIPAILDSTNILKIDSEASKYLDSEEAKSCLSKIAVITPSLMNIIMLNSWIYVKKREVPIKLFKSFEEAENWIFKN